MPACALVVRTTAILLMQVLGLVCLSGCVGTRVKWREPVYAPALHRESGNCAEIADIESLYALALDLHQQKDEGCVDLFFETAALTCQYDRCEPACDRLCQVHQSALRKLVVSGQQFGRLDPRQGLTVNYEGGERTIPFTYRGFVWRPDVFHRLIPVGDYKTKEITRLYRRPGIGVPLVVTGCGHPDEEYLARQTVFAATLRLSVESDGCPACFDPLGTDCLLELSDPLRIDTASIDGKQLPIAKDLSAPLAYRFQNRRRTILGGVLDPGTASPDSGSRRGNLYLLEPYQAGKIPLVLIHGLLADPFTWAELVNDLLATPGFVDRFQIWVFEYPTGRPFLGSAAELREQLESASRTFDPLGADPELSNLVLAGHSMGGLIAKLQVTSSGDRLWQAVAKRPLDQLVITHELREELSAALYFEPSPRVSRVVFFATPHRGSAFATRLIGRIGSALVSEPEELQQQHRQLICDNPGVFSKEFSRRIPTSIDFLEPQSPLLQAIETLPVRCRVTMHSVVGNRCCTLSLGQSDGIVPVKNAHEPRAVSERIFKATHSKVKERPESTREMLRILDQHLEQSQQHLVQPISLLVP